MNVSVDTFRYSVLPRVGVAAGFLIFSALVLGVSSRMQGPAPGTPLAIRAAEAHLIVTPREFRPAFESWREWNHARGESFLLLSLDTLEPRLTFSRGEDAMLSPLGALCIQRGITTLLIAGSLQAGREGAPGNESQSGANHRSGGPALRRDSQLAARLPGPGLRVYRAPIRNLEEAWAFVNDCRSRAATLGDLIDETRAGAGEEIVWTNREAFPTPNRGSALLVQAALSPRP